ncbi:MAG: glycoside hydrolase family 26 protein [Chloroflexota bacterium]
MPVAPVRRSARLAAGGLALALIVGGCSTGTAPTTPTLPIPTRSAPEPHAPSPAVSCTPDAAAAASKLATLARSGPASGTWVGMNIDWGTETVADVAARLGRPPAVVVSFVAFPLAAADVANLDAAAAQARDAGAVLVATLEPWSGLAAVTDASLDALVERLKAYGRDNVPTIVRFAHEMNGSWYPWGEDATAYVAAFRRVADAIHDGAPTAGVLWAPNQGDGYPYIGGKYAVKKGSAASKVLDTNNDGRVDGADDPYAPYWPGDAYVDWVGMSLYHWGTTYPWGANVVPAAGKFAGLLTGATTSGGHVPDFYADYAERHQKPLAIIETAALYRPAGKGATASAIKLAWLGQVISPATLARFPRLRLVNWFEWKKNEAEVHDIVDWRISADPKLRAAFLAAVSDGFTLGPVVVPEPTCPAG